MRHYTSDKWQDRADNLRRAHQLFLKERGSNHIDTLKATRSLGFALTFSRAYMGQKDPRVDEGLRYLQEAYDGCVKNLGQEHPETLRSLLLLGGALCNEGQISKAEPLLEQAYPLCRRVLGPDHEKTLDSAYFLGGLRHAQSRFAEARNLFEEVLAGSRKIYGERHLRVANLMLNVGGYTADLDQDYEKAARILQDGLSISRDLVGNKYPTPHLLERLFFVRLAQKRFEPALAAGREFFSAFEQVYGPGHSETPMPGRWVASRYGRVGDWDGVIHELQGQRARGITDGLSLAQELLARHLAGEPNGIAEITSALSKQSNVGYAHDTFRAAAILLTLPGANADAPQLKTLVNQVFQEEQSGHFRWALRPLLEGLSAYRRGEFNDAARILSPVAQNLDHRRLAVLARYFKAMALQNLGNTAEAKATLESANDLLNRLLRGGDLQLEFPGGWWSAHACSILARNEAEKLILGKIISPPVTKEALAAARERWKSVHDLLLNAIKAAQRQEYKVARDLYVRARQHPDFELEVAFEDFEWIIEFMPAIFAHAGDREGFVQFLREAYRENVSLPNNYFLPAAYISWELPPDMKQRVEKAALASKDKDLYNPAAPEPHRFWNYRHLGMTLYRLGHLEEAYRLLPQAINAQHHGCALSAAAYASLTAWKLGHKDEAKKLLAKAEEGLKTEIRAGGGKLLGGSWWHLAITDLALKEARSLMH